MTTQTISEAARPQEGSPAELARLLRRNRRDPADMTWLHLVDRLLIDLEDLVWEVRSTAVRATSRADNLCREIGDELEALPGRTTRMVSTSWLLTRLVASYRLYPLRAAFLSRARADRLLESIHRGNARRFRRVSREQGGAFLKLGQLLSARPDLLPRVWVEQLSTLQDAALPLPFEVIRREVEADLGGALKDHFEFFSEESLAAASIGQVHRAVTHDGVEVAVKVQRPEVADVMELDLELMEVAMESLESMLPPADYETITREVREMLRMEVDYRNEAQMFDRFAEFFEGDAELAVPHTIPGLCGERVITTHFMEGEKITKVLDRLALKREAGDALASAQIDSILGRLLEAYLRQIIEAGCFQADPHPGNLLVDAEGCLVVLDFGCTKELPPEVRDQYVGLLMAFLANDRDKMTRMLESLGFATLSGRSETLHAFADILLREFSRSAGKEAGWPDQEDIMEQLAQLVDVAADDPVVRIPSHFVMLGRVFATLGGLYQHYQPKLDFGLQVAPMLASVMAAEVN